MFTIQNKGFTMIELLIVVVLFAFMLASGFLLLASGQDAWQVTSVQVQLQDNLRQTLMRVSEELRETGPGGGELSISDGGGFNNSDVIKFSIPVICEETANVMDENGNVAHWGASLSWGCTQSTCMDADNNCNTVDYKYIEYRLNTDNQLVRRVLNSSGALVRQDIFAEDIIDFQSSLNLEQSIVTLEVTASTKTSLNRQITASNNLDIYLRNRG